MEKFKNIRPLLSRHCSFRDALTEIDDTMCSRQMMGMTKSTFNIFWSTCWQGIHKNLITPRRWMEMLNVSQAITENFPTPTSLKIFCDTSAEKLETDKYNLFMEGKEADYWISAQTIPGHFEIKVHSIAKGGS